MEKEEEKPINALLKLFNN